MEREGNIVSGNGVNGILRKCTSATYQTSNHSTSAASSGAAASSIDLLVFGYGCKLFRDDNKAKEIDHGKHLIPWMGDNNLKIDRYDVRGALYDLTPFEPIPGGYGNRLDYLSADEQRAEQLCEEERYLFLYKNETEFLLEQEENAKRLDQRKDSYKQVELNYDEHTAKKQDGDDIDIADRIGPALNTDDSEEAFKLPINFLVSPNIQLPSTMKQHAIIEKTARFIAAQGVQMEILLKAKQCNNVQFEFLAQNSVLNPYYKYLTNAIKNGVYPNEEEESSCADMSNAIEYANCNDNAAAGEDANEGAAIIIPTIKYMPSANCAYTQLISKIKGVPLTAVLDEKLNRLNSNPSPVADGTTSEPSQQSAPAKSNALPHVEVLKTSSSIQALAQDYSSNEEDDDDDDEDGDGNDDGDKNNGGVLAKAEISEADLQFPLPTENLKNIIDKTAIYVIKNGRQFEETLRTKSAERFAFLLPDSKYYPYYMYKVTGDVDAIAKEQKTRKAAEVAAALISKKGLNIEKTASPVSFSIKSKEDTSTAPIQTVLSQETSSDDDADDTLVSQRNRADNTDNARNMPEHVQKAIKLVERNLMARNVATAFNTKPLPANNSCMSFDEGGLSANSELPASAKSNRTLLKHSKIESERNAIYEQQQQNRHKELKKAEEKVKDKLAQIAREKLGGLLSKEKQLQMERKRKAEAFLNQIKGTSMPKKSNEMVKEEEQIATADNPVSDDDDDSECSVHSVPISYYGPDEKSDDEETQFEASVIYTPPSSLRVMNSLAKANAKIVDAIAIRNSDDDNDVELLNDHSTLRIPSSVRNYVKEKYRSSRSRSKSQATSRSRDEHLLLKKKRKHHRRDASSDSQSSSYSSNSDKSSRSSSTYKRYKLDRKSERSTRYAHSARDKRQAREHLESSRHKSKSSNSNSRRYDRDNDSLRNDYQQHYTSEHRSTRHKHSSTSLSSVRKRDNKMSERGSSSRGHKISER